MRRWTQVLAVAVLAVGATVALGGGGGGGGGRGGRGGGMGGMGGGMGGGQFGGGIGGMGGGRGAVGGGFNNGMTNNVGGAQLQPGAGGVGGRGGAMNTVSTTFFGIDVSFYTNEFVTLQIELTIVGDQKAKLQTITETMNAELQRFIQNALPQTTGRGARGGRAGGLPGTLTSNLTAEQTKLRDDFLRLAHDHQIKIDAALTDDQKREWETYKINLWLNPHLAPITLTDSQRDIIKTYVADTAKAIAKATDGSEIETLLGRLYRRIIGDLLTEPQAAVLMMLQTGNIGGGRGNGNRLAAGGVGGANGNALGMVGGGQGGMVGGMGASGGGGRGGRGGGMGGGGMGGGGGRGGRGGGMGGGMGGGLGGGMGESAGGDDGAGGLP